MADRQHQRIGGSVAAVHGHRVPGGRAVSRSRRLRASANDAGDRFSTSTTVRPPSSATA